MKILTEECRGRSVARWATDTRHKFVNAGLYHPPFVPTWNVSPAVIFTSAIFTFLFFLPPRSLFLSFSIMPDIVSPPRESARSSQEKLAAPEVFIDSFPCEGEEEAASGSPKCNSARKERKGERLISVIEIRHSQIHPEEPLIRDLSVLAQRRNRVRYIYIYIAAASIVFSYRSVAAISPGHPRTTIYSARVCVRVRMRASWKGDRLSITWHGRTAR